jgi:uncharacterized protein
MKRLLLQLLAFYRYWLSPAIHTLFPSGCRYQPTCSQYASDAIAMHGAVRGCFLALRRLLRCHPFGRGGYDPVPLPRHDEPVTIGDAARTASEPLP